MADEENTNELNEALTEDQHGGFGEVNLGESGLDLPIDLNEPAADETPVHNPVTPEDLAALATHLLDPRPEFDVYRALSTMPLRWGTAEIRLWAADAAKQHHR